MRSKFGAAILAGSVALAGCDSGTADVPAQVVATVDVAPGGQTLAAGQTMKLTAYPKTLDGTVLGGRRIDWTSTSPAVATISANGTVTAVSAGTTRITATVEGRSGGVDVTVVGAPLAVATIEILNVPGSLNVGQHVLLQAVPKAADGTVLGGRVITWRSSHGPTASVTTDPNPVFAVLSGHAAGAVVITAEAEGVSASAAVAVGGPGAGVGSIVLGSTDIGMWAGATYAVTATVHTPAGGVHPSPPALTWTVDDPLVATVDATGRVRAVGQGTTRVRAAVGGIEATARITVHVLPAGEPRWLLQADVDPAGAPRTVELGTLTWYGDRMEGEPATEILRSGALKLITANGVTRYEWVVYFDVVADTDGRRVGFGSISDTGLIGRVGGTRGDEAGLYFVSSNPQVDDFAGRIEANGRIVMQRLIGAAPMMDYAWVKE